MRCSVAAILLLTAGPALAQEFELPSADVEIQVSPDGSLIVTERITFSFDGSFSGAYREIPLAQRRVDQRRRRQRGAERTTGRVHRPSLAPAGRRAHSVPRTWATGSGSCGTTRQPTSSGPSPSPTGSPDLATAWDDVVDINLQVWGSEWEVPVDRLTARLTVPGTPEQVLVWGHPASVEGTTSLGADGRSPELEASDVPAGQWVELRVAFSRDALESVRGARVREGEGLPEIRAEEERAAEQASRDAANTRLMVFGLIGLVALPAPLTWLFGYLRWGREPKVALRPRVRAGAAVRSSPCPGRRLAHPGRGGNARVHRDAVRPDPQAHHLRPFGAGRAQDVDGTPHRDGLRPRIVPRHRGHRRPGGATSDGGDAEGSRRRPGGDHRTPPTDQGRRSSQRLFVPGLPSGGTRNFSSSASCSPSLVAVSR